MILGISGYAGLAFSLIPRFENKWHFKITLLSFGILGFIIFNTVTVGKDAWKWILKIEEIDDWIIWVWPTIVSLTLILINGQKLFKYRLN